MRADVANYRRAVSVSLLGLLLQSLVCVALVVYSAYAKTDQAAVTAAVYVGLGVVIWGTLYLLYDFHRRERLEAAEIEQLAQDPAASAFDEGAEQLRVAGRRLAGMQRFFLPIVAISLCVTLIVVGLVRFGKASPVLSSTDPIGENHRGWAIAIGLAAAFIGFVFARFVYGMSTQKVWTSLRAGASHAVGTALFGVALAVGHFVELAFGRDLVLRGVQAALPIALVVLGAEVGLNFVFDLYRPRKPGDSPRPAFDSRVLGLLAAPDRIAENVGEALNYQFGVNVTETWFYQLLRRWWIGFAGLALLLMWGLTSLVVIEPHQRALILRFGAVERGNVGPGLHVKWPWPIGSVYIPETVVELPLAENAPRDAKPETLRTKTATGVRVVSLGSAAPLSTAKYLLWTNDHSAEEVYNLVQPSRVGAAAETSAGAGAEAGNEAARRSVSDLSLVSVQMPMHYSVSDVLAYERFAQPGHRDALVEAIGQRAALQFLGSLTIDDVLADRRTELARGLRERVERDFTTASERVAVKAEGAGAASGSGNAGSGNAGPGIEVLFLGSGNVHPPKDVAPSFERVVQAEQVREANIESAERDRIRLLAGAAGSVEQAQTILARLAELDELRRTGGASAEAVIEREVEVQALLEQAGGEAGALLMRASADRWTRHMGERGRAALFEGQLASFEAAPALYKSRLYFTTMREMVRGSRVFLTADDAEGLRVVTELQTRSRADVFDPETESATGQ